MRKFSMYEYSRVLIYMSTMGAQVCTSMRMVAHNFKNLSNHLHTVMKTLLHRDKHLHPLNHQIALDSF